MCEGVSALVEPAMRDILLRHCVLCGASDLAEVPQLCSSQAHKLINSKGHVFT